MSTRCVIARTTPDGWMGRYVHSNGYPAATGEAIWTMYRSAEFYPRLSAFISYLIDEHPAGWSALTHRVCYCHMERRDPPMTVTHQDEPGLLYWAYILDEPTRTMRILKRVADVTYRAGLLTSVGNIRWQEWATVDLEGTLPDWEAIERGT